VGTASNFVKADLSLNDSQANLFPSLVFFWFLIFSVPTGILMNKIGRKNTVILSLLVTVASLILPMFAQGFMWYLIAFSLLGIGNTLMQTSLNPLISSMIGGEKLASTLTFGQFVKAIASFLAPLIASWGSLHSAQVFGMSWRVLFPIYGIIGIIAVLWLSMTTIEKETVVLSDNNVVHQFIACFKLLGNPFILLCFIAIVCHVGIDVGTNTTAPKILMERVGMTLDEAAWATSLYFIFRTIGCFTGSGILQKLSTRTFMTISVALMVVAMILMGIGTTKTLIYIGIACVGYGNSNVFSMTFSSAILAMPEKKNEVSGLMIMGLFGGTLFPLVMGQVSDGMGSQTGAVMVMAIGVIYLAIYSSQLKKK
jgi:fucose permease